MSWCVEGNLAANAGPLPRFVPNIWELGTNISEIRQELEIRVLAAFVFGHRIHPHSFTHPKCVTLALFVPLDISQANPKILETQVDDERPSCSDSLARCTIFIRADRQPTSGQMYLTR